MTPNREAELKTLLHHAVVYVREEYERLMGANLIVPRSLTYPSWAPPPMRPANGNFPYSLYPLAELMYGSDTHTARDYIDAWDEMVTRLQAGEAIRDISYDITLPGYHTFHDKADVDPREALIRILYLMEFKYGRITRTKTGATLKFARTTLSLEGKSVYTSMGTRLGLRKGSIDPLAYVQSQPGRAVFGSSSFSLIYSTLIATLPHISKQLHSLFSFAIHTHNTEVIIDEFRFPIIVKEPKPEIIDVEGLRLVEIHNMLGRL